MVKNFVRVRPWAAWDCQAIFMATSTETEPESARNTLSSTRSGSRSLRGARATSRSPSDTAGWWVRPPNITWLIESSCERTAASSSGTAYPWIAHHHDDIASTTSLTEPSGDRRRSRVPEADSTTWTGEGEVIEEYGCHRWSRSKSRSGSANCRARPGAPGGLPVLDAARGPVVRRHLDDHAALALRAVPRRLQLQQPRARPVDVLVQRAAAATAVEAGVRHVTGSRSAP